MRPSLTRAKGLPIRTWYLPVLVAALLAAPAAMSGCGRDDAEGASAYDENTVAKADFVQAANAACEARIAEMKERVRRLYGKASQRARDAGAELLIERAVVPVFEKEIKDLQALQSPPGDEDEVAEVISAIEEMVDRTRRDLARDRPYPYRKTENLASAYGLPACGHP
jgi:hypothetical protein